MYKAKRKQAMDKLLFDIHVKREEMITCGLEFGFNDSHTLEISQELDILIVKYQKYKEQLDKPEPFQAITKPYMFRTLKVQLTKKAIGASLLSLLK